MSAEASPRLSNDSLPPLNDADFEKIADRIYRASGNVLASHKKQMAQARIGRRLTALGLPSFSQYLTYLDEPGSQDENREFVDALTTNLTSFFREPHHFEHLEKVLMPQIEKSGQSKVRIWSAACSTGEEPYSIALTTAPLKQRNPSLDFKILATDINNTVLRTAKAGQYTSDRASGAAPPFDKLIEKNVKDGMLKIPREVANLISFRNLNLFNEWPFQGTFDAIFCRNVIIYFEVEERKQIVDRLVERIVPGGYLFLGHSEALIEQHPKLKTEGHTLYRKLS